MVDSTALLMAAVLCDEELQAGEENSATTASALRATYGLAFSRFVTGLLDGQQDKARKQSMYALAKGIGLPATFVELRHECTHEQLPSLAKLREAARKALDYIWHHYWKNLEDDGPGSADDDVAAAEEDSCEAVVLRYLREFNLENQKGMVREMRTRWDIVTLLKAIEGAQGKQPGNMAFLKARQLAQDLKDMQANDEEAVPEACVSADEDSRRTDGEGASTSASSLWQIDEDWRPLPIGCYI